MFEIEERTSLKDVWDPAQADALSGDELGLLQYRSNLLGSDLRVTNFGGGNTSSKIVLPDPFTGEMVRVLAVKGSGGDLGSIKKSGFALLRLERIIERDLSRRTARRSDGALLSSLRIWRESRGGVYRYAAARVFTVPSRRPPSPRLGDCACSECQRQGQARGVQPEIRSKNYLAALAATRI